MHFNFASFPRYYFAKLFFFFFHFKSFISLPCILILSSFRVSSLPCILILGSFRVAPLSCNFKSSLCSLSSYVDWKSLKVKIMLNASKSEYSESPNVANGFQFDSGKPEPLRPDVLTSSSTSVDSQSDEHDVQPTFWKPTGHFQEKSQSTASVQEKSRPAVEFQEKSQPADHFQEKSLAADSCQEKSRSTDDVPEKSRAVKINRPKSKMITSSSAAPATAFAWWRRHKPQKIFLDIPTEEDPAAYQGRVKRFSLLELQLATDSFRNRNILGRDGFGKVYKGRLADGSLAAVKRLQEERNPGWELLFLKELETTSMPMHRNVLKLQGFCMTPTERLLVYPFMANGSVASWLRERPESHPPLDWPTRKRIALGSARGLSYLHDYCPLKIIHLDVKAANILLDENFEAVIGDFGLAKSIHHRETQVTYVIQGTIGHIAPEYLSTGIYSDKADVYGYGIMLLELITGQTAFDLARLANDDDVMLLDWVKGLLKWKKLEMLIDPDLWNNYVESEVEQLIKVALLCTQGSPMDRPKMSVVVRMLEGDRLAERCDEWQKVEDLWQKVELALHPNANWTSYSTDNLNAVELSGPR